MNAFFVEALGRTERAWIQKRRDMVADDLRQHGGHARTSHAQALCEAREAGGATWTDGHEKERRFQQDKRRKRLLEATSAKVLLRKDRTPEDDREAKRVRIATLEKDVDRKVQAAKRTRVMAPKPFIMEFRGKRVYVDDRLSASYAPRHDMPASGRLIADYFVVPEPSNCGALTRAVAMLRGGVLATPAFMESMGQKGSCLVLRGTLHQKRFLWMSPEFVARNADMARVIAGLLDLPVSKWQQLHNREAFRTHTSAREQGARRVWRTMEVIGLCTKREKRDDQEPRRTPDCRYLDDFRGDTYQTQCNDLIR